MLEFLYFCQMRWLKFGTFLVVIILGIYAISMSFVAENKTFTLKKEINYSIDKIFPQFNNLQNFSRWNAFFTENPNLRFDFFHPMKDKEVRCLTMTRKMKIFSEIFSFDIKIQIGHCVINFLKEKKTILI